jgi:transcriptional regulator with PAS, ATPase and Fis domain
LLRFLIDGSIELAEDGTDAAGHGDSDAASGKLKIRLRSEKIKAIREALVRAKFDKELAASMLGISRAHLYRELAQQSTGRLAKAPKPANRRGLK